MKYQNHSSLPKNIRMGGGGEQSDDKARFFVSKQKILEKQKFNEFL